MRLFTLCLWMIACAGLLTAPAQAQPTPAAATLVCPPNPIQPRPAVFEPGGLILTTFDRASLWVLDVNRRARFPLPGSRPCGTNCHLSPDARWFTFFAPVSKAEAEGVRPQRPTVMKMRLNGSGAVPLAENANEVSWWSADTLLAWSPTHQPYLQAEGSDERVALDARDAVSIQPGGQWALVVRYAEVGSGYDDDVYFERGLVNLQIRALNRAAAAFIPLGPDLPYFNSAAWSPDGTRLAYAAAHRDAAGALTAELYTISPGDAQPAQRTDFAAAGEPVRIGGQTPLGGVSWSPDSRYVAFWVTPIDADDPLVTTGESRLYVLDAVGGGLRQYCGFTTADHTPNPPRLVWSPDSTHVAFGGNLENDTRGVLLLALNITSGVFVELSEGIYPALGSPNVIAWGLAP